MTEPFHYAAPGIQGLLPLPANTALGDYVIDQLLNSGPDENHYVALARNGSGKAYRVIEYPASETRSIAALAKLQLEHPALLAPCAALTLGERTYVITPQPQHAQQINVLSPPEALQQIITIGEALAYLHSQGVAHLRVQPGSILLIHGGACLGGLEDAQIVRLGGDEARLLFERDANFLALTLGALAGMQQAQENNGPLARAISKIREQGSRHSYQSAAQVIADCQQALGEQQATGRPGGQHPPRAFSVLTGHATSVGRVRANNEDALGELVLTIPDGTGQSRLIACFVVADGMGGEAHGELASQIATQNILEQVARRLALPLLQWSEEAEGSAATGALEREQQMREALVEGFRIANRQIRTLVHTQGRTIGTTTTALLIFGGQALIAHVGDSRVYRLNRGVLTLLTEDHSFVQRLIRLGQIDPADQASHPRRNALYRALGQQDEVEVDLVSCPLEAGDCLLLCSDGLWDAVPEATIANILTGSRDGGTTPARAALLVALADEAGGQDNSTALLIEILTESLPGAEAQAASSA
ncbi:MAG TPA: protein phosphatase 2C domain-containing protein [Ktedonobacterales bacterium]|nr:protein phosphatase 2C domain-containing protein [Ktedonobacterales bacterium]